MPPTSPNDAQGKDLLHVLVTGYGPFHNVDNNPSWLAVAPLHNKIIHTSSKSIHITAIGPLKVTYETVLAVVPGLYARPPQLPSQEHASTPEPVTHLPRESYNFIFHLGLGHNGYLSIEQVGHKSGYQMRDVDGKLAPIIASDGDDRSSRPQPSAMQQAEAARLGESQTRQDASLDRYTQRGFAEGYERFPESLRTEVDVNCLIDHLAQQGETRVRASSDAGNYLCDYICYCGLAESRRASFYFRDEDNTSRTKSLFMHVPSINAPHSLEEMTESVRQIVAWVCTGEAPLPQ